MLLATRPSSTSSAQQLHAHVFAECEGLDLAAQMLQLAMVMWLAMLIHQEGHNWSAKQTQSTQLA